MKKVFLGLIIGLVLCVTGYLFLSNWLFDRPDIRFGDDRAAVITKIQLLGKLETASFNIDKIIEAKTDYGAVKQFFFGDKLVLIAHGTVTAGVDLTKMKPSDFVGYGDKIEIRLPAPEIFSTRIDNRMTQVFDRDKGIFTKGQIELESEARAHAETTIQQAACEGNILASASEQAKKQLEILFAGAGFTSITITIPGPANSQCNI